MRVGVDAVLRSWAALSLFMLAHEGGLILRAPAVGFELALTRWVPKAPFACAKTMARPDVESRWLTGGPHGIRAVSQA